MIIGGMWIILLAIRNSMQKLDSPNIKRKSTGLKTESETADQRKLDSSNIKRKSTVFNTESETAVQRRLSRKQKGRTLEIVVIGVGLIGPRHAEHVVKNPTTNLFAIVDLNTNSKQLANRMNTNFFQRIEDMIKYCRDNQIKYPDGAIVCTPNHTHVQVASELANHGINLLIEKPLSPSAEDSKALKIFTNFKKVKVLIGHHRRFNPFIVATKQQLSKVGKVIAVQGTWTLKKDEEYFRDSPWRTDCATGGGVLLINLIHDLDLLQYLFGPISQVYAEPLAQQRQYKDADEGAILTLRFKSGVCGTFICSDNVTSPFNFETSTGENPNIPYNNDVQGLYRIFGSEGTLSIPDFNLFTHNSNNDKNKNWLYDIDCEKLLHGDDLVKQKPFDFQLDHFVNIINNSQVPSCTIDDGISALLVIESVKKSIETNKPQVIPDVTDIKPNFEALHSVLKDIGHNFH